MKMEEYIESELFSIFRVKLVAKNIALVSLRTNIKYFLRKFQWQGFYTAKKEKEAIMNKMSFVSENFQVN